MKKKTRATIGLLGFSSFLITSTVMNLLGRTGIPVSLVLAVGGGLGFFVAWWIVSGRYQDIG